MMAAVHRYEGTVNQVMDDGIMALFGALIAHEDHAVRAMQETIRRYSAEVRRAPGVEVHLRVGLNSGEVVVHAIGSDLHMDYSAIRQTTHLAAGMEQLALPGSIRLTAATSMSRMALITTSLRLAEELIQVNALGPMPVKGLREPAEVCELVGATAVRRRLQATVARPDLLRRTADRVGSPLPGAAARRPWAGPTRGGHRRAGCGQVAPGVRVPALAPHPGLAGAGECLGVLWQGHALLPRHRSAQALNPCGGA
jgi:Adenylate and Guanylate cyclase catalytic domain